MLEKGFAGTNGTTLTGIEDGKLQCRTIFHDDKSLEQNNKIRLSGMMEKAKLGLHDNEDMRYVLSIPSTLQWQIFKKKNPDIYKLIKSSEEAERMRGCKLLHLLEPDWVIMHRA